MNGTKGLCLYLFGLNAKIVITIAHHLKRAKQTLLFFLMISEICVSKLIRGFMPLFFFAGFSQKSAIPH